MQDLASHNTSKVPVMSTNMDDVLRGISLIIENWNIPPRPPGAYILYISSKVRALWIQELGHCLLKAVSLILMCG